MTQNQERKTESRQAQVGCMSEDDIFALSPVEEQAFVSFEKARGQKSFATTSGTDRKIANSSEGKV